MKILIKSLMHGAVALMVVVGPVIGSSVASADQDSSSGPIAIPCCTKACGGCL